MRIALGLEYNGSGYAGWQLQAPDAQGRDVRTIQAAVEAALTRVADQPIRVHVAGRTDAGVHALQQVVHFDTDAVRSEYSWVRGANSNLPNDIAVLWAKTVDEEFHARFSATGREYRYVILNRAVRPALLDARVSWDYRPLDVARMQAAASSLIGTHDFTSYRAMQCQAKNPVRELRRLDVTRRGEYVTIAVAANGFLHHMVRNIAGVLMSIGAGEQSTEWAQEVLQARDRTAAGITAPPQGLYLSAVEYPPRFALPRFEVNDSLDISIASVLRTSD